MPKFEINYEFSGFVVFEVEAADADEAMDRILDDANGLRPYGGVTPQGYEAVFTDGWPVEIDEMPEYD